MTTCEELKNDETTVFGKSRKSNKKTSANDGDFSAWKNDDFEENIRIKGSKTCALGSRVRVQRDKRQRIL